MNLDEPPKCALQGLQHPHGDVIIAHHNDFQVWQKGACNHAAATWYCSTATHYACLQLRNQAVALERKC